MPNSIPTKEELLEGYKQEVITTRHDLERVIELADEFKDYIENVELFLRGKLSEEDLETRRKMMDAEIDTEEDRFLQTYEGLPEVYRPIASLLDNPTSYSKVAPKDFRAEALEAMLWFDGMIRKRLRELAVLHDRVAALTDDATAKKLTDVDAEERGKFSKRIRNWDEAVDVGIKWGNHVITILPRLEKGIETVKQWSDIAG
jgi:hypothetical protein